MDSGTAVGSGRVDLGAVIGGEGGTARRARKSLIRMFNLLMFARLR